MGSSGTKRTARGGFTLIELLVVVAIIGLLISLLLPSLQRARKQARSLKCATHLRAQGQAAALYAADNRGYVPRGIQGELGVNEYAIYATSLLGYLGWHGEVQLRYRADATIDVPDRPNGLWGRRGVLPPRSWTRVLNMILRKMEVYQCPDYPAGEIRNETEQVGDSPLDYVTSAIGIPYSRNAVVLDCGNLEWDSEDSYARVRNPSQGIYVGASRVEALPAGSNPSSLVYVTESHVSLPWRGVGPRFHTFFLGQHLPFGLHPRIARDRRHVDGINAMFFDGSVRFLELHKLDPAYPNPLDERLRLLTVLPPDCQP